MSPNNPDRLQALVGARRTFHDNFPSPKVSTSWRAHGAPCMQEQDEKHNLPVQKHVGLKGTLHWSNIFPIVQVL